MPKKPKYNEAPCPQCREPVHLDAQRCPHCQAQYTAEDLAALKKDKNVATGVGLGCLGMVVVAVLVVAFGGGEDDGGEPAAGAYALSSGSAYPTASAVEEPASSLTGPQENAFRAAKQYLSMSGFSRAGLIQQLSSDAGEGYEVADATAAVESLNVDWNEQAVRSAKQYLDTSAFSCKGLIQQLSSSAGEKFSPGEAAYGAKQAGAC